MVIKRHVCTSHVQHTRWTPTQLQPNEFTGIGQLMATVEAMQWDQTQNFITQCFVPINRGGQIYFSAIATTFTPSHHLAQFRASSPLKLTLILSSSTCPLYVFFGLPRCHGPFTSSINTLLRTWSPSFLKTCPYQHIPFTFASCSTNSSNPSIFL